MVLADRSSENMRNGRRSRGPSPSEQSSDLSTDEESAEKIRVGREYQAVIPPLIPVAERKLDQCPDRALLVWSPTTTIADQSLDMYINIAKEKYGYNGEQALGMLFWHKHILQNAIDDLPNFTPFPDEWTVEDKVLFEQAFQFHGKSFHRIRQMLPDKSIATLVKHYYSWKKTRCRTSLMDKHARKLVARSGNSNEEGGTASDAGSEVGSNTDSDSEEKKWIQMGGDSLSSPSTPLSITDNIQHKDGTESKTTCSNCGVVCTLAQTTSKGPLCNSCYTHWRRTGSIRPTVGPAKPRDRHANSVLARSKRKPPRGMYINHDDLVTLSSAEQPQQGGDAILKSMDRDIVTLKRQVQSNKQILSSLIANTADGLGEFRPSDNNTRINARWTNEEMLLAVQGIRMHGKDFATIAEIIGTKTETHVRSFYANHRKRYNLDKVVSEYEAEHGPVIEADTKMDVDGDNTAAGSSAPASPATPKHAASNNKVSSK